MKSENLSVPDTERVTTKFPILKECLDQGGTVQLFPLMKAWDRTRLNALLAELEKADGMADQAYGELATSIEYFFSPTRSRSLDAARMELVCIMAEISSVALYYLGRAEVKDGQ
jgi:hypothetical protein